MRLRIIGSLFIVAMLASTLAAEEKHSVPDRFNEATVAQLQAEMSSGHLTSEELTKYYLARIIGLDQNGPGVNAVIEVNPDALVMARNAEEAEAAGTLAPIIAISG